MDVGGLKQSIDEIIGGESDSNELVEDADDRVSVLYTRNNGAILVALTLSKVDTSFTGVQIYVFETHQAKVACDWVTAGKFLQGYAPSASGGIDIIMCNETIKDIYYWTQSDKLGKYEQRRCLSKSIRAEYNRLLDLLRNKDAVTALLDQTVPLKNT